MVAVCTPPFAPTSSPNTRAFGFTFSSCSSVRRIAVTILMRAGSGVFHILPVALRSKNVLPDLSSIGFRARQRSLRARLIPRRRPRVRCARHSSSARTAGTRYSCNLFRGSRACSSASRFALIRLRVLAGMPAQTRHGEPQQRRAIAVAHPSTAFDMQASRFRRIAAIGLQDPQIRKRAKVGCDVSAWRLQGRRNRETEAVVFYIKQHRQA